MATSDFLGKGWAFPVRYKLGSVCYSQDDQNIKESILILLQTSKGERVMNPEFGCQINELIFAPSNNSTFGMAVFYIEQSLQRWEPRIVVKEVDVNFDQQNNCLIIKIDYLVKDKNSPDNVVYPFYLKS